MDEGRLVDGQRREVRHDRRAAPPIVYEFELRTAPWSMVLSLLLSVGAGLVFGVCPGRKAAHLPR